MARYINPVVNIEDSNGAPYVGAKLVFYETGTTTLKTIYSDSDLTTPRTNPVTAINSDGGAIYPDIFISGIYKVVQQDDSGTADTDDGATIWTRDPVGESTTITGDTVAPNGSFEENTGTPTSWTISAESGATIATDTVNVRHGLQSLKFDGGGSGGGTATSDKFPVRESSKLEVKFSFYATNATTTNTFQIKWYKEDDTASATASTNVYTAASGHPTSWRDYIDHVPVPSDATQAEIVLTGIGSGGSNLSADAYFDGIAVYEVDSRLELYHATDTGAADAYVVDTTSYIANLRAGMGLVFTPANDCTNGGVTLNWSGTGATAVKLLDGTDPNKADIDASGDAHVIYDGTNYVLQNPADVQFRGCLVYKSANEELTTATYTHLSFNTESYDTDSIHDTVTNNQRLTVPTGVTKIKLFGAVVFESNSTGTREVSISKNDETTNPTGVIGLPKWEANGISGLIGIGNIDSAPITVTGGDYFTLCAFQTSGAGLEAIGGATYGTYFGMEIIE